MLQRTSHLPYHTLSWYVNIELHKITTSELVLILILIYLSTAIGLTPGDSTWYPVTVHDTRWQYMKPGDSTWDPVTVHDTRCQYMTPGDSTWHSVAVHDTRWQYMTPGDSTWHPVAVHYAAENLSLKLTEKHTRRMFQKRCWEKHLELRFET
jgi:hypothetical protein